MRVLLLQADSPSARINDPHTLVLAGRSHHSAGVVPGKVLDELLVLTGRELTALLDVPDLCGNYM